MPDVSTALIEVTTTGDLDSTSPVATLTEVGAFVRSVQQAVLDGEADVAVHSCKDLPVAGPEELSAIYPVRESPWDVLVGAGLGELGSGARVGTGSPRRTSQLRLLRPDLQIDEIRGNVDTRLTKLASGEYDAIVLAEAGLIRLGRTDTVTQRLRLDQMVPAPAQGALAVETARSGRWFDRLVALDDADTRLAVLTERLLLERTGAGCRSALGALTTRHTGALITTAFIEDDDGPRRASVWGRNPDASIASLIRLLGLTA